MVKCKWCKTKTRTNYYLLKFNGRIIAHFCSILCLSGWADREYEESKPERKSKQAPLAEFYDHKNDTSTEVMTK